LVSIFFVVALMSGVSYLSYINGKKSIAFADDISRLRLVLHTMSKMNEQETSLETAARKYLTTGDKKYFDSCETLPPAIYNGIATLEAAEVGDSGMQKTFTVLKKEAGWQQHMLTDALSLYRDSVQAAWQILNSEKVKESFYNVKREINEARENEDFIFAAQTTTNQVEMRNNLNLIFIRNGIILFLLLVGLLVINLDIQKRMKAEKIVLEEEKKYAALIEGAGDLVCTFNYFGALTYTSSRIETLSGYDKQELLNKHYSTVIAPEWKDRVEQLFKEWILKKKREALMELQVITRNGEKKWVEIKTVLVSGGNDAAGILCICRDINEKKKAELQRADASRNQEVFLANMSHEIRTPMNGIIGLTHLLSQTGLNAEQNDYLKGVRDSARKLLTIINDILDISKINAGKIVLEEEPFSLKELIDNTVLTLGRKAKKQNIKINTYLAPEIPAMIMGDHVRLSQILWNLADNAVKYNKQDGEVCISVTKQYEDEGQLILDFAVKDSGIGIENTLIPSVFEPFIQANPAVSRKYGTGLGLSISKKLVELQGGAISVQSILNEGSLFSFSLNFKKYTYDKTKTKISRKEYNEYKHLKGASVLLVEDNIINQKVGVKMLEKEGIKVEVAVDGKKSIEMLEKKTYDLILMDLQMPEMNGFEATKHIRTKMGPGFNHIPIIAITAASLQGEYERCLAAGMNDYLLKPFEPRDLFDKMEHLVNLPPEYATVLT